MALDPSALTDHSWSDIAKAAKHAMVSAAMGGADLTIAGWRIGRISIKDAKELYELATQMAADESTEASSGIALVQYGERV
jgi:hypothetical protein